MDYLTPSVLFPDLRLASYIITLEPRQEWPYSENRGSVWRGAIGNSLMDLFCPWSRPECRRCRSQKSCPYYFLFEFGSEQKGLSELPRPYIFYSHPSTWPLVQVGMTLIGCADELIPQLAASWARAGERGVGQGRHQFNLVHIDRIKPDGEHENMSLADINAGLVIKSYPLADFISPEHPKWPLRIIFKTPLRIQSNGRIVTDLDWGYLFKTLAIRLSCLNQYYCDGERISEDLWDQLLIIFQSPNQSILRLEWQDEHRYSNRQKKSVPHGGLVGDGFFWPEQHHWIWWHWWQTAALFHLGKGTGMGLGQVVFTE
ncbi:MAG: CRISPR system precrRNA processing endoribonuclease RAMP protein Cas6 [Deltaproteobacteria bacterium]|nr:CRISPR system precrRNA processing endoribonuclease RAMP protein Cas6 [Deltaproteobacteria bacterium]